MSAKRNKQTSIAEHGRTAAQKKREATVSKIDRAKKTIAREIARNFGIYPHAGGRLSVEEVLRRAGLDRALLAKPRHEVLRAELRKWVTEMVDGTITGHTNIRRHVSKRADDANTELDKIRQRWAEAELEFAERSGELSELRLKCERLEADIRELHRVLADRERPQPQ
jgi:hypothetical protein